MAISSLDVPKPKFSFDGTDAFLEKLEQFVIRQGIRFSVFIAPVVPGVLVYSETKARVFLDLTEAFHWGAFASAMSLELVALGSFYGLFRVLKLGKKASKEQTNLAWGTCGLYTLQVLLIVLGLKIAPEKIFWVALVCLSTLSITSALVWNLLSSLPEEKKKVVAPLKPKVIEKIVEIEVEKIVEKIVEVPTEKIVEVEKIVEKEKIVKVATPTKSVADMVKAVLLVVPKCPPKSIATKLDISEAEVREIISTLS